MATNVVIRLFCFTSFAAATSSTSHAFHRGIPNKLVQLQPQTYRQAIRQDPLGQKPRL
jgi:hypothetical protein